MKYVGWAALAIAALIAVNVIGYVWSYADRAAEVVDKEIDPAVLLQKYMWFKDASAQLDKKVADIAVYDARFKKANCGATADRVSREQCMVWDQEEAGIIASYNGLAAEYNSQMAKINWAFTNVGQLPRGATEPLPREYKPYQYQ